MPWVRFDDQFPIHRKVDGLSDAAYRLHTSAIFWSARNLTDGFLPRGDLDGVTARVRTPARFAAECVKRGTWHDSREPCTSQKCPAPVDGGYPQGWVIHDYWDYQPSKEQVLREREAAARRQKKWRDARNGVSNATNNALLTLPRPAPKGSGTGKPPRARAANGRPSPSGSAAKPRTRSAADRSVAEAIAESTPEGEP